MVGTSMSDARFNFTILSTITSSTKQLERLSVSFKRTFEGEKAKARKVFVTLLIFALVRGCEIFVPVFPTDSKI